MTTTITPYHNQTFRKGTMDMRVLNFWAEERPVYKTTYQLEGGEPCPGSLLSSGQRPRGSQGGRGGAIDHDSGVDDEYSDDDDHHHHHHSFL